VPTVEPKPAAAATSPNATAGSRSPIGCSR